MKKVLKFIALSAIALYSLSLPVFAQDETPQYSATLNVTNVRATALNGSVKVEWDAVPYTAGTIKGYAIYYMDQKMPSTEEEQAAIQDKLIRVPETGDLGNVTSYTVTNLTNGKKYYFYVIAIDTNGVESEGWSVPDDASATPTASSQPPSDTTPPQVSSVSALNKEEVKVVFSEEIVLPATNPENAFSISNTDSLEELVVKSAVMDATDAAKKTVILTTEPQEKDAEYKLIVSIDVEDKAGNPIRSEGSALASFTGSDKEKGAADTKAPELVSVEAVDNTHVMLNFNEKIVLGINPSNNFRITAGGGTLSVKEAILGKSASGVDGASVLLTTASQKAVEYTVTVTGVKDSANNNISSAKNTAKFTGIAAEVEQEEENNNEEKPAAPKDVAKILAKKVLEAEKYNVTLSWTVPAENTGKITEQLLYKSVDKGKEYTKETSLAADAKEYEVKGLDPGEYWFKLTQKDNDGAETKGTIVKVILAKTGPEMLGLVFLSLYLGRSFTKRKK